MGYYLNIEILKGEVLTNIEVDKNKNQIIFTTENGKQYLMLHEQECCEAVYIEDICGDIKSLIGSKITMAEEITESDNNGDLDSYTWTFYKLATVNGYVTIRWYGESNGYYSEGVDFIELTDDMMW